MSEERLPCEDLLEQAQAEGRYFFSICVLMTGAPEGQMSRELVQEYKDFVATNPSEAACYDMLAETSQKPLTEISSFVMMVCNVKGYYERPKDVEDSLTV